MAQWQHRAVGVWPLLCMVRDVVTACRDVRLVHFHALQTLPPVPLFAAEVGRNLAPFVGVPCQDAVGVGVGV